MSEHLLFRCGKGMPHVDLYSIVDNPNLTNAGYYFVHNKPGALKEGRMRVMTNLRNSERWGGLVSVEGDDIMFTPVGVDKYELWVEKFLEYMLISMNTTCGLSGRGTEILSLLYKNTMEADGNIFIEDGPVMFVTEYHKSVAIMDNVKVIPRFLAYRLSQLLVVYLTDVLPFRQMINPDTPQHGYLFGDAKGFWNTDRQTKAFVRESTSRIGFRMTSAEYRHVSIAIDRKFIRGYNTELDETGEDVNDIHDLMLAHSSRVANNRYARDQALLRKLTAESIDKFRSISDRWQHWLKLVSRFPRNKLLITSDQETKLFVPLHK